MAADWLTCDLPADRSGVARVVRRARELWHQYAAKDVLRPLWAEQLRSARQQVRAGYGDPQFPKELRRIIQEHGIDNGLARLWGDNAEWRLNAVQTHNESAMRLPWVENISDSPTPELQVIPVNVLLYVSLAADVALRALASKGSAQAALFARLHIQAKELIRTAEGIHAELERKQQAPHAKRGKKVRKGASMGGDSRAATFDLARELWGETAIAILNDWAPRKPSRRHLAQLVARKLHPELTESQHRKLANSRRGWLKDL